VNSTSKSPRGQLRELGQRARAWFVRLSLRERVLIVLSGVIGLGITGATILEPIQEAFLDQELRLAQAEQNVGRTADLVEKYLKLKSRRDAIEREYQGVEIKEGAVAYLERLLGSRFESNPRPEIKDLPSQKIGTRFEQNSYTIRAQSRSLDTLVQFLKDLVHGEHPLLLTRLKVARSRRGDRLEFQMDVSTIRETAPQRAAPAPG